MFVPFNAKGEKAAPMTAVPRAGREHGSWPFAHRTRVQLAPPPIVSEHELECGLQILGKALDLADDFVT